MAPSFITTDAEQALDDGTEYVRPAKRQKCDGLPPTLSDLESSQVAIPQHPMAIKPSGNAYTATANIKDFAGSFRALPDEVIVQILDYLDASSLIQQGWTCKFFYACSRLDELWKNLFLESSRQDFTWNGSWRSTCLSVPQEHVAQIQCQNLYSDVLYRPFHCARLPLASYAGSIPHTNNIPRLPDISEEEFTAKWTNKPFILTEPIKEWPIAQQPRRWTTEHLLETFATVRFRAEAVDWPLETYVEYMRASVDEESPLYLFDRAFAEKMKIRVGTHRDRDGAAYWPPQCFGEDLFAVLGEQRPDCRWLIVGPESGGSTFHTDPNATSAWNAIITGSKYWLMFPPNAGPPPGVFVSEDKAEVTSPLSIAEYLLTFHDEARRTLGCREGVCHAGEVLHVPSGWFHLVVNLEESVAVTQNFVPRGKLADVLSFLKDTPEQVSGFARDVTDPYDLFVERLRKAKPEVLEDGLKEMETKSSMQRRRGKWEDIVQGDTDESAGIGTGTFSFGFADDSDPD